MSFKLTSVNRVGIKLTSHLSSLILNFKLNHKKMGPVIYSVVL
jgi:hypothetical protein